jgi:hypothetical protein
MVELVGACHGLELRLLQLRLDDLVAKHPSARQFQVHAL